MSNHTAHAHLQTERPVRKIVGYVWLPATVVAALVVGSIVHHRWIAIDRSWPSFPGRILDSRTVPGSPFESITGGGKTYRLEVRASWTENGAAQDAWMPTEANSGDLDFLRLFASQHTTCMVRRNPHRSGYLIADLVDDWQPLHPTSLQNGK